MNNDKVHDAAGILDSLVIFRLYLCLLREKSLRYGSIS